MARKVNRLSPVGVTKKDFPPGRHSDGAGLYLVVDKGGARRWVFLFRWGGKLKEMGLGGLEKVSLGGAREKARLAREALGKGQNPIAVRRAEREVPAFGAAADAYIKAMAGSWRNEKHKAQWEMTLRDYCAPIRDLPVNQVGTEEVLSILTPIWESKPETAARLRGRIERVLAAASAKGHRSGENPARWRGHLKEILAARRKLSRGHHKALDYRDVPEFVRGLRSRQAPAARALEFLVLTAARTGEVVYATWAEVDLEAKVWCIPPERMKASREHRVPLGKRAIEILEKAAEGSNCEPNDFIFRGASADGALSTNAFRALLQRMDTPVTAHGFRASFRTWGHEASSFQQEILEAALAHVVGDETERAYLRGDALRKRRRLMEAWAGFIERGPAARGVVTPFPGRAA